MAANSDQHDDSSPADEGMASMMSPNSNWKRLEPMKTKENSSEKAFKCIDVARGVSVVWNEVDAKRETLTRLAQHMTQIMRLKHPNLVQVFDYWIADNKVVYITESLTASTLKPYIKKDKKSSLKVICRWVTQIVSALRLLHVYKRPLRRLRPENIYVQHTGQIKISPVNFIHVATNTATQFAKRSGAPRPLSVANKLPQSRLIELAYCGSSEEASSSSRPKEEDDIYALGILVLELIMQERAFSELFHDPKLLIEAKENPEPVFPEALQRMATERKGLTLQYNFIKRCLTKSVTVHELVFDPWLFRVPSLQAFAAAAALSQYKDPDAVCTAIEARWETAHPVKADKDDNHDTNDKSNLEEDPTTACNHLRTCQCSLIHMLDYPTGPKPQEGYMPVATNDTTIEILLEQSHNGLHPLAVVADHGPKREEAVNKQGHRKYLRRLVPTADVVLEITRSRLGSNERVDMSAPDNVLEVKVDDPRDDPLLYRHTFTIYYCLGQEKQRPKPKRDQISPDNSVPPTPREDPVPGSFNFDQAAKLRASSARTAGAKAPSGSTVARTSSTTRATGDDDVPLRAGKQASDSALEPRGKGDKSDKGGDKGDTDDKLDKRHVWRKLTLELAGAELLDLSKVLKPRKSKPASKDPSAVAKRNVVKSSTPTPKTIAHKMAETLAAMLVEYELLHRDDGPAMLKKLQSFTSQLYPDTVEPFQSLASIDEASERTLPSERAAERRSIAKTSHVEESPLVAHVATVPKGQLSAVSAPDSTCCEAEDEDEPPSTQHAKDRENTLDKDDRADNTAKLTSALSATRLPSTQSATASQAMSRHSSARSTSAPTEATEEDRDQPLSGMTSPTDSLKSPPPGRTQSHPTTPVRNKTAVNVRLNRAHESSI
eukprot:m.249039 g.249039  ORF g.249039 m.249039 type:complete len:888 (-) comp17506_c1_seq1:2847-5510(-)